MGFPNIQHMQGTTRVIYDSLQLQTTATNTILTFFENVNTRKFPFTNLTENKFQIGETMALQRFSMMIVEFQPSTQQVKSINSLAALGEFKPLYRSDMNFLIAQDTVIKKLPLQSLYSAFNKDSRFNTAQVFGANPGLTNSFEISQDVFWFDNDIVLPPQIEFLAQLQIPPITLPATADRTWHLMITMEGLGSLYAPKANY